MSDRARRVHPNLVNDIAEAIAYYGAQDGELPGRFIEAYAASLRRIEEYPLMVREYLLGYRRVVVLPFPYLLAYAVDDDGIYIAALLHVRRDPATNETILRSRPPA
jgi:hypothetical protein